MNDATHARSIDAIFAAALGVAVLFGVALNGPAKSSPSRPTTMCHYAAPKQTITVSVRDVAQYSAHLAHGDTVGPCRDDADT